MSEDEGRQAEGEAAEGLSDEETEKVAEETAGSPKVVHEVIRLQGDDELDRPALSLLFSGFAAGVAISASMLAQGFLKAGLPDARWAPLVSGFGYTTGFVIVILGNLQLFTESTITPVLPLATHPTARNLWRLTRLWFLVFVANMAGTLLVAALTAHAVIVSPEQLATLTAVAQHAMGHDATTMLFSGMPAGFLVAAIAWLLPSAKGGEFWVVFWITYVIAIGEFSHVVVGSGEAWLCWLTGSMSFGDATMRHILPSLVGNVVGGTGLFAVVAHGQVRGELGGKGED